MQRRTLLKLGFASAAVLSVVGGGLALWHPGVQDARLTAAGRSVFAAIGRGVLDGALPSSLDARNAALRAQMDRLDVTIAGLSSATRSELSDLLALLASPPGRMTLAGLHTAWTDASAAEVQDALQGMRRSSLALRRQAYQALRDLTLAAYYADAATWTQLGYPGPIAIT
jgi:hypothetical protein